MIMPGANIWEGLSKAARGIDLGMLRRRQQEIEDEKREREEKRFKMFEAAKKLEIQQLQHDLKETQLKREVKGELTALYPAGQQITPGTPPQMLQPPSPGRPGMAGPLQRLGQGMGGRGGPGIQQMLQQRAAAARPRPGMVQPGQPGTQVSPLQAASWANLVQTGGATPLAAGQMGLAPPGQMSPYQQQQMGMARTPVAQEEWQAQERERAVSEYSTLAGVDINQANLALRAEELGVRKMEGIFDREGIPERLKQGWLHDLALEKLRQRGQERAAGRRGGVGAPPKTLTTVQDFQALMKPQTALSGLQRYWTLHNKMETQSIFRYMDPASGEERQITIEPGHKPWEYLSSSQKENWRALAELWDAVLYSWDTPSPQKLGGARNYYPLPQRALNDPFLTGVFGK